MLPLVFGQIAAFDGAGQRRRLAERQTKAFAGHCVHRTRSVADQRHAIAVNRFQFAGGRDGSPLGGQDLGSIQAPRQFRHTGHCVIQAELGIVRDRRDTHRIGAYRRHVDLITVAPVELHMNAPGLHSIMPAEPEAAPVARERIQTGPFPDEGPFAVRTDEPAIAKRVEIGMRSPPQGDAGGFRVLHQDAMKRRPPHTAPGAGRKISGYASAAIDKANAAEGK